MSSEAKSSFVPIATKASFVLKDKAADSFKVTVFEPKKAALQKKKFPRSRPEPKKEDEQNSADSEDDIDDIFSDAPRKKHRKKEDPTIFDISKARKEVINFGLSGLDKDSKLQATVALAIKLGAKAPKNKCRNYREILEERKAAKQNEEDRATKCRTGQIAFGATQSYNSYQQRKREKQRNPSTIMKHYGVAKPRMEKKRK
uniref:Uncharacterized protein n=1 Tax=Anopheles atroparvus TaxID=41427 RepID=A0A182ILX1_ANOAO